MYIHMLGRLWWFIYTYKCIYIYIYTCLENCMSAYMYVQCTVYSVYICIPFERIHTLSPRAYCLSHIAYYLLPTPNVMCVVNEWMIVRPIRITCLSQNIAMRFASALTAKVLLESILQSIFAQYSSKPHPSGSTLPSPLICISDGVTQQMS